MNFLAHGYLSGKSDPIVVGNFIADFVKGNQLGNFSPDIVQGIKLHRKIDEYTDSHAVVLRSKNRIRSKYRHYTGVIIDMYYDHILARNWNTYSDEPLETFCEYMYRVISSHFDILPPGARHMFPWMSENNWLLGYATLEGIDRSLKGLSRRTTFESGMENAVKDLEEQYQRFSDDFSEFFPDLIYYVRHG